MRFNSEFAAYSLIVLMAAGMLSWLLERDGRRWLVIWATAMLLWAYLIAAPLVYSQEGLEPAEDSDRQQIACEREDAYEETAWVGCEYDSASAPVAARPWAATDRPRFAVAPNVPAIIDAAAARWGLDAGTLRRIAWCESRWQPFALGADGSQGIFQFQPITWAWASIDAGFAGANVYDAYANIETAARLLARGGWWHWRACL